MFNIQGFYKIKSINNCNFYKEKIKTFYFHFFYEKKLSRLKIIYLRVWRELGVQISQCWNLATVFYFGSCFTTGTGTK